MPKGEDEQPHRTSKRGKLSLPMYANVYFLCRARITIKQSLILERALFPPPPKNYINRQADLKTEITYSFGLNVVFSQTATHPPPKIMQ